MKNLLEKIVDGLKKSGLTKLTYAGIAVGALLLGLTPLFYGALSIFIYVNANTLYKAILGIKF